MLFLANGVCQNNSNAAGDKEKAPDVIIKSTNVTPTQTQPYATHVQAQEISVADKKAIEKEIEIKDDDTPYFSPNEMPAYLDGKRELPNYVARTAKYPAEARRANVQGIVIVQIIVEKDGSITNPQVIQSVHPKLDSEALRVIGTLKGFNPGKQNGEPVRCYYQIPVPFVLLPAKK